MRIETESILNSSKASWLVKETILKLLHKDIDQAYEEARLIAEVMALEFDDWEKLQERAEEVRERFEVKTAC